MTAASAEGEIPVFRTSHFFRQYGPQHSPVVSPLFFGTFLVVVDKKDGGVRLITVGSSLHRLVQWCLEPCQRDF